MIEFELVQPRSLGEALQTLRERGLGWRIIAGGTDVLVGLRAGHDQGLTGLVDISGLYELAQVEVSGTEIIIGALTTFTTLLRSTVIRCEAPILAEMAAHMGSPQIRNRATLGGNLANASASADSVPPLLVLEAEVELCSTSGTRRLPLEQFIVAPGRTVLRSGEMLVHIRIPRVLGTVTWHYEKLGRRNSAAISRISVAAARIGGGQGAVSDCRLAVGAVTPVPLRLRRTEASLREDGLARDLDRAAGLAREEIETITGRRWSSAYKLPVLENLVGRALASLYGDAACRNTE